MQRRMGWWGPADLEFHPHLCHLAYGLRAFALLQKINHPVLSLVKRVQFIAVRTFAEVK